MVTVPATHDADTAFGPVEDLVPVPQSFMCPIAHDILRDPVVTMDGHTYEREFITRWFKRGRAISPLTNTILDSLYICENRALSAAIAEFQARRPELAQKEFELRIKDAQIQSLQEEVRKKDAEVELSTRSVRKLRAWGLRRNRFPVRLCLLAFLAVALALLALWLVLSEVYMRPLGRLSFWPTFPITLLRCWLDGQGLATEVDNTVILGVVPSTLLGTPDMMQRWGVKGVVNMQDEYVGPVAEYARRGIEQLWLPTVQYSEPSLKAFQRACEFIDGFRARGERVYVHSCFGRRRGGAVALAWLLYSNGYVHEGFLKTRSTLPEGMLRGVPSRMHNRPNLLAFAEIQRRRPLMWVRGLMHIVADWVRSPIGFG